MAGISTYTHLLDLPLTVEASAAGPQLTVGELLELEIGSVVISGLAAGETVSVYAATAYLGEAELDQIDGKRAVRMVRFREKK